MIRRRRLKKYEVLWLPSLTQSQSQWWTWQLVCGQDGGQWMMRSDIIVAFGVDVYWEANHLEFELEVGIIKLPLNKCNFRNMANKYCWPVSLCVVVVGRKHSTTHSTDMRSVLVIHLSIKNCLDWTGASEYAHPQPLYVGWRQGSSYCWCFWFDSSSSSYYTRLTWPAS